MPTSCGSITITEPGGLPDIPGFDLSEREKQIVYGTGAVATLGGAAYALSNDRGGEQ